jgi:hypothetical protein
MTRRRTFKTQGFQAAYDLARKLGADRESTFYVDGRPRRGAGHRCAYWAGRCGEASTYSERSFTGYPYFAAGVDDRVEIDGLEPGPTWREYQEANRRPETRAAMLETLERNRRDAAARFNGER